MSLELWYKYECPICDRDNFVRVEHWDDPEVEAINCWYCVETCWFDIYIINYTYEDEMSAREKIGKADPHEVNVFAGRPRPRMIKFRANKS